MTIEKLSLEEYMQWMDSLSYAERARDFYKKNSDMTFQEIENMIKSHSEIELKEIFERDVRLLQDKEAYMRGDKNHKYSNAAVFLIEAWEHEKKMKG